MQGNLLVGSKKFGELAIAVGTGGSSLTLSTGAKIGLGTGGLEILGDHAISEIVGLEHRSLSEDGLILILNVGGGAAFAKISGGAVDLLDRVCDPVKLGRIGESGFVSAVDTNVASIAPDELFMSQLIALQEVAPGTGGRQTLIHFTDEAGEAGILNSQKLFASSGSKHARFGDGQYFTDIVPENIGAARIADLTADQVAAGQRSLGQVSSELFGVPWNSRKLSNFVEIDVTGLNVLNPRPGTFLIPNSGSLDLSGRIIRSGSTLKAGTP